MNGPSVATARLILVAAAVLWSTSGAFMRLLQKPTVLYLEEPALSPLQIAFYRSFFAGLGLVFLVRRSQMTFRSSMAGMVFAFGIMTAMYLSALGGGAAANAILLQNTSPVWVYVFGVYLLGDLPHRRTLWCILLALVGALIIVIGNWPRNLPESQYAAEAEVLLMATGSGFFYAIVVLLLRHLRSESAAWLTTLNLLGGAVVILAFAALHESGFEMQTWLLKPTVRQYAFMAIYGAVQLAVPYVLFSRGLKAVSPQEAGIITLIEPLLNPLWAYLISPETDTPTVWTLAGGLLLLAALAWRYWPSR